ncbi:MAG: leucine-rich repeat domain-containing protein [Bacteroidales bacterium]|nr:leucine-rich repeat domain-containing protein [Bacteroidales bacterium]
MITKQFEFKENEEFQPSFFSVWLLRNKDVECLKLVGKISFDDAKIDYGLEDGNIKEIDISDCEIYNEQWDDEWGTLEESLLIDDDDEKQPSLLIKLFCNKQYTTRFVLDDGEVYSIDKKLLVQIPDARHLVVQDGVEHIGIAAFAFYTFRTIELPNTLKWIDAKAFYMCDKVTTIELPQSVMRLGEWSFAYCNELVNITFSDAIEEIPACCFRCLILNSLNFPKSLKIIRSGNSFCCEGAHVILPEGMEIVESDAFDGCTIKSIYVPSSVYYMSKDWYYEYPCHEEGELEQPRIELSPDNPYFRLEKGKLVHNYVPNEKAQKECSKKVLEYIDSKSLQDYLMKKDLQFTPQEMIAIAINSKDRHGRRIDWFLEELANTTFLSETDRLYLEYEIKRVQNNWNQLNTNWGDERYYVVFGKKNLQDTWRRIFKYTGPLCNIELENRKILDKYTFVEVRQYLTNDKSNTVVGKYTVGKYYVAEDCWTSIDIKIPTRLKEAIRKERQLPKNKPIDWTYMLSQRYIQLPIPFKRGDVVRCLDDDNLYVVIDASQPSGNQLECCDVNDMSVAVAPLKYKEQVRALKNNDDVPTEVWNEHNHISYFRMEIEDSK